MLFKALSQTKQQEVKRSGLRLQPRDDGEDEVPERGVLSDEEA